VPTIRRTVKRLQFGWATREACMLCRPDALARLWVFERVISVYVVLNVEAVYVRGGPVAVEGLSNLIFIHRTAPVPRLVSDLCPLCAPSRLQF
jgi:hypothetical protein